MSQKEIDVNLRHQPTRAPAFIFSGSVPMNLP